MKSDPGPPATLGSTAEAGARIVVWCLNCGHSVEPDPAEMAARYGADTPVSAWHKRLRCSRCDAREIDFVLTGARGSESGVAGYAWGCRCGQRAYHREAQGLPTCQTEPRFRHFSTLPGGQLSVLVFRLLASGGD